MGRTSRNAPVSNDRHFLYSHSSDRYIPMHPFVEAWYMLELTPTPATRFREIPTPVFYPLVQSYNVIVVACDSEA